MQYCAEAAADFLAPQSDAFEALNFAHGLFDTRSAQVEHLGKDLSRSLRWSGMG
jgi:hypothetical protein